MTRVVLAIVVCALLWAGAVQAAPTAAEKCQADKNVAAGKYGACRQTAEKTLVLTGDAAKYASAIAKCEATFAKSWQAAIDKAARAGAICPDAPLEAGDYKPLIDAHSDVIARALNGDGLSICGNGILESGEQCDFGTLGTATCDTATGGAQTLGTLACGGGCVFDTSQCKACPGRTVGGFCWIVGASNTSCTSACASNSLTYHDATRTYAGSSGTDGNCQAVADAFSYPYTVFFGTGSSGLGCFASGIQLIRDVNTTSPDASQPGVLRFCACQ
jgi:hypothetical protein